VAPFDVKVVADTPLNLTELTPSKLDPVIVIDVPTVPLLGVNDVMTGRLIFT